MYSLMFHKFQIAEYFDGASGGAETSISIPKRDFFRVNIYENTKWHVRLLAYAARKKIESALTSARRAQPKPPFQGEVDRYLRYKGSGLMAQEDPLEEEAIEYLCSHGDDVMARHQTPPHLSEAIFEKDWRSLTTQQKCGRLVAERLSDTEVPVDTVANFGSQMDVISPFLAERFPNTEFVSVDFPEKLEENNTAVLPERENWTFESGYPLTLLQEGKISPDILFCTSTSVLFRTREFEAYLEALSETTNILIFNESWFPETFSSDFLSVTRPEDINPGEPYLGGEFSNYHHNYKHLLGKHGYEISLSRILSQPDKNYHTLQLVAYNTQLEKETDQHD